MSPTCIEEDIKKYYRRQAVLVHPDKNRQPGAEEAFKILAHAFEMIGEPEKRQEYDKAMQLQQFANWAEVNDLISSLRTKMEEAVNALRYILALLARCFQFVFIFRCTNCSKHHMRYITQRKQYAARYCSKCRLHHPAKDVS